MRYLGCLVISTAGRDKGELMFVVEDIDENRVKVANGKTRRVEKPKLKKIKHIKLIDDADESYTRLVDTRYTNRIVREKIAEYCEFIDASKPESEEKE